VIIFFTKVRTLQCGMFVVLALKIHMSKDAYNALMAFPEFITECRHDICDEVVVDYFPYHYALNQLLNKAYSFLR